MDFLFMQNCMGMILVLWSLRMWELGSFGWGLGEKFWNWKNFDWVL